MKDKFNIDRRKFLGTAACAGLGYSTLLSSLFNLKGINAAAMSDSSVAGGDDYKALVCILLAGGNDSFNMLVPKSVNQYNEYATTRSNLALDRNSLLTLNEQNPDGREFGVHPSMGAVQGLFNDQKLAFISNIGTLVEQTNKQQVIDESVRLPLGLFSHSDQIQQWQTGLPHVRSTMGWGGRVADMIRDMNTNQNISMNISLDGTNTFQVGRDVIEYSIDAYSGSVGIDGYGQFSQWDFFNNARTEALNSMIDHQYQDMFKKTYTNVIRDSRDAHIQFQEALNGGQDIQSPFADNYLIAKFPHDRKNDFCSRSAWNETTNFLLNLWWLGSS